MNGEQAYDRAIELAPNEPVLKVLKALVSFYETGIDTRVRAALAELPESMAGDRSILSLHLSIAVEDRDWQKARELVEKMKGGQDGGDFGYAGFPVPVNCYLILVARLQGNPPSVDSRFVEAREELNRAAEKSPAVAPLVSTLAVVDALLGKKEDAIAEAKRAAEMLPVSGDAEMGPGILTNLASVYAWTGESDLAIATLAPLTKMPNGPYYGLLKRDPIWDPLRKDPRFEKLLAELAPRSANDQ